MARLKGSKNKATLEREALASAAHAYSKVAQVDRRRLAKEDLEELVNIFKGRAAYHQMSPEWRTEHRGETVVRVNGNPNYNEEMYRFYVTMARDTMRDLAPYQSPRLSAVAVGQVTKLTVIVKGGLPPRDTSSPVALIPKKPDAA